MSEAFIYDAVRTPRGKNRGGGAQRQTHRSRDRAHRRTARAQPRTRRQSHRRSGPRRCFASGRTGRGHRPHRGTRGRTRRVRRRRPGQPLLRLRARSRQSRRTIGSGFENLVVAGGVESMSRVPLGSDGGAWAQDPATNYDTYFVPQGIGADLIATTEASAAPTSNTFAAESQARAAERLEERVLREVNRPCQGHQRHHAARYR